MAIADVETYTGRSLLRVEDEAILRGEAWFVDDLDPFSMTAHAAVVRSQFAHARVTVDESGALGLPGVIGVLTPADVAAASDPLPSALSAGQHHFALAIGVARYVGEPLAVVVATSRYIAEDAAALVEVDYEPLPVVASIEAALAGEGLRLHDGDNVRSDRDFSYGDPDGAFARADLIVRETFRHRRSSATPIETTGVIVNAERSGAVTAYANFQGPFTLHGVAAAALRIRPDQLRLITPEFSGGSYGTKSAVIFDVVLMALASRKVRRPVRYCQDRSEQLTAGSGSTERLTAVEAAFTRSGELIGLRLDLAEDVGAYVRAPEPATLYRMHGCMTGPYRVRDVAIRSRVCVTNRAPTGLNRGFGGPQLYSALERTMAIAARRLGIDVMELAQRNVIVASEMPYNAPAGSIYDSGDYPRCLDRLAELADYAGMRAFQSEARASGRLVGIGLAVVVEPSVSNMGYITLVETAATRAAGLPKSGNAETATVSISAQAVVTVRLTTTPQGQGHRTVVAQIVADVLGVDPGAVVVSTAADTANQPWTVSAGNYSSRFAVMGATAVQQAATALAGRLRALAAAQLECDEEAVVLTGGGAQVAGETTRRVSLRRLVGGAHWNPMAGTEGLAVTSTFAIDLPPPGEDDRVNSSACYGFIADLALVEVDAETGVTTILDYASVHDAGRLLNPLLAHGQLRGGLIHGVGAALYEEQVYDADGMHLTSTFVDYLPPTAVEAPVARMDWLESPSPLTPLGAKGLGEGNTMSAPAAIGNAVADAIGVDQIELPATPARVKAAMGSR